MGKTGGVKRGVSTNFTLETLLPHGAPTRNSSGRVAGQQLIDFFLLLGVGGKNTVLTLLYALIVYASSFTTEYLDAHDIVHFRDISFWVH